MLKARLWAGALGALSVLVNTGFANDWIAARPPYCPPCPPGYSRPVYPPGHMVPGQPAPAPVPKDHPSDLPADVDPMRDPMAQPQDRPAPDQVPQDQQLPPQPTLPDLSTAPAPTGPGPGLAGLGGGAQTPMLGRVDAQNRMNIFDTMSAIPASRLWFGYMNANELNPNVQSTLNPNAVFLDPALQATGTSLAGRTDAHLYRVGVELAVTEDFSVAAQGQYFDPYGNDAYQDDWTDPQFLLKYVVYRDCGCEGLQTVVSATLGFQIETEQDPFVIDSSDARIYPGMLFYTEHSRDLFSQGGVQVGIPWGQDPTTFDWSYALGYWLYRADEYGCDDCNVGCDGCGGSFLRGIAPQVGVLGKHVWGDNDIADPYGIAAQPVPSGSFDPITGAPIFLPGGAQQFLTYEESRHVIDLTVGASFVFEHGFVLGAGYSIPLTGADQREDEFLAHLIWYF